MNEKKDRLVVTLISFDLPSKPAKTRTDFVKHLKREGFVMLQESLYYRICLNKSIAATHVYHLKQIIPDKGSVIIQNMTELQFRKIMFVRNGSITYNDVSFQRVEIV